MNVLKKWVIRVDFADGSSLENVSKKDYRENSIMDIITLTEKKFPHKIIISVHSV